MTVKVFCQISGSIEEFDNVGYVQVRVSRANGKLLYFVEYSPYSFRPIRVLYYFKDVVSALDFADVVNSCYKKGVNTLSFSTRCDQFSYTTEEREEELNEERV